VEIVLNQDALLARRILFSLRQLLAPMHIAVNLGKTQVRPYISFGFQRIFASLSPAC
jgi:hypothetical protein